MSKDSLRISPSAYFPPVVAPANPVNGMVYFDSASNKLRRYENGVWVNFSDSQTSAPKNYLENNGTFETGVSGWAAFNTTFTNGVPTTITGGSTKVSFATTTTNPLTNSPSGAASGLFSITDATASIGHGIISSVMTIEDQDLAKVFQFSANYRTVLNPANLDFSGTSTQTLEFWIYNVGRNAWTQPSGFRSLNTKDVPGVASGEFQTDSSDASNNNQYRLALIIRNTPAGTASMQLDTMYFGRSVRAFGSPVTDWVSWVPTGSFTTNTTYSGRYRRVGSNMEAIVRISFSGTPNSPANTSINLPSGFSIDTLSSLNTDVLGYGRAIIGGVGYNGRVQTASATSVTLESINASGTYATGANTTATVPATIGAGSIIYLTFSAPIAGWSSAVQMSDSANTRVISLRASRGSALTVPASTGTAIPFTTVQKDTSNSYNPTTGVFTAPVSGTYRVQATVSYQTAAWASGNVHYMFLTKNPGAISGGVFGWNTVGSTASVIMSSSGGTSIDMNAGDTLTLFAFQNSATSKTLEANGDLNHLSIELVSGPAAIAATETVSCAVRTSSGQSIPASTSTQVVFNSVDHNTHEGTFNTATGTFTAPVSGLYETVVQVAPAGAANLAYDINIFYNGTQRTNARIIGSNSLGGLSLKGNWTGRLLAGQTIFVNANFSGTTTLSADAAQNYITIKRVGN